MSQEIKKILDKIAISEEMEILDHSSLAGGSINQVFLLKTTSGNRVLKLNESHQFPGMFEAEKKGLETLKNSQTIAVPEVFSCGKVHNTSYLLLEYKSEGKPRSNFWELFAQKLAMLHQTTQPNFGFSSSNYIGSLPQYNRTRATAADFYISQRLEPQIKMAGNNGFNFKNLDAIFKNISEEIPKEPPALVHGDLWSGNYLVNLQGLPCLIDPAVCFSPREMDLAMMQLFGGFPNRIFEEYSHIFPLKPGFEKRIPLWQLYYLLVHLNIFGAGYLPQVKAIFHQFS